MKKNGSCWRWAVLVLWLLAPCARAAEPPSGWLPDAALSRLMLRTLAPTPDGLLWVGTDDGVFRYDGTELVALNALRRSGPELPAVPCNWVLPLPDGSVWLGTEAGLFAYAPATGTLQALPLPAPAASQTVDGLALAPDGRRVWVTQHGAGTQAYTRQGRPTGPLLPFLRQRHQAWPAPDGTVWLTGKGVAWQLSAAGQRLGAWHDPAGQALSPLYDPAGRPWLLSNAAAYRPGPGGQLREVLRWAAAGQENRNGLEMVRLLRQPDGPALLTSQQIRHFTWAAGAGGGLQPDYALPLPPWPTAAWGGVLCTDRVGSWWVFDSGTRSCWHRAAGPVFIRALAGPGKQPYSVRSSTRLPDGRLLVSTYEQGLLTQAADSPLAPLRRWPAAALPDGHVPLLMGVVPAPLGPGGTWLAGGAYAFLQLNPRSGEFRTLGGTRRAGAELTVLRLVRDSVSGRVWAGLREGLYAYDPATYAYRPFVTAGRPAGASAPPLAGRTIEDVAPAGPGHLWLATPEGVEYFDLATGRSRRYGPKEPTPRRVAVDGARCLYLAPDGRLWVGTRAHGLAVIGPDGRAAPALTVAQGLPNASVASIVPGPDGSLWVGTYQGLVRYEPAQGRFAVFTTAQGLASDECNACAAAPDPRTGSLLIGGVAGLNRVYPAQVPGPAAVAPRLLLTSYSALNTTAGTRRYYLPGSTPPPALRLAPDQPLLTLHLALTNVLDAARARYAYRVRGWLGEGWVPLGASPTLALQGLPPGDYTVDIRAESSQGTSAANHLHLPLAVRAAWYNRPLVWAAAGLLAVALVYGWQRSRLRRVRRENALRTQLAANLHDEVGSLLTRVTMQAELMQELQQGPPTRLATLAADSRAAAATMRDVIWSVDSTADTLAALLERMRDHATDTARATGCAIVLHDGDLPTGFHHPLSTLVRQNLYLIFKEAVNNALKYSARGSAIEISLSHPPALRLLVRSVGPPVPATADGQGLQNMRRRAEALGAAFAAGPVPGGWEVRVEL